MVLPVTIQSGNGVNPCQGQQTSYVSRIQFVYSILIVFAKDDIITPVETFSHEPYDGHACLCNRCMQVFGKGMSGINHTSYVFFLTESNNVIGIHSSIEMHPVIHLYVLKTALR